jgi:hypothetical protein
LFIKLLTANIMLGCYYYCLIQLNRCGGSMGAINGMGERAKAAAEQYATEQKIKAEKAKKGL